MSAVHIAGKLNCEADYKSRVFNDKHEYMLNKAVFQSILHQDPDLNLDMFASRLNTQLDDYASWNPDPECKFVDAFSVNWKAHNFYAFPPFSLIPRCLQNIQQDKATGIMIIPLWPTQAWFPLVLHANALQPALDLTLSTNTTTGPSNKSTTPTSPKTSPDGVSCLRQSYDCFHLSTEVTDFIMQSRPGAKELRNSTTHTLTNGWNLVVKGRFLTIQQR